MDNSEGDLSGAVNSEVTNKTASETPLAEEGTNPNKSAMVVNSNEASKETASSSKNPHDETMLESDMDEDSNNQEREAAAAEANRKKSGLIGYGAVYALLFILAATIIIVPSVIATSSNLFKDNETPAPAPTTTSIGGLSLPAPQQEVTSSPSPKAWLNPVGSKPPVTVSWQSAEPTLPPTGQGESRAPSIAPSYSPSASKPGTETTTAEITPRPTQTPSSPSDMPTTMPTLAPTTSLPSSLPTVSLSTNIYTTPLFNYLVVLGTPEEILSDPTTPQGQAFLWLMDPQVEQISVFRVAERYALVALDFALHESSDATSARNENDDDASGRWRSYDKDACEWGGVTCNPQNEVVGIKWSGQGLTGEIIHEIGLLSNLETLDLAQNRITGTLDPFWQLSNIKQLYLFENRFSGVVPEEPAPDKLERVFLGHNNLEGPFPAAFTTARGGGPDGLRYLILHHNNFNGTLPERLRLRQIYYLDLSNNQFEGSIAHIDWPQMLPAVRIMYLNDNNFSEQLSEDFPMTGGGNMKQLFIDGNQFTGVFPARGWSDYHMTNMNIARNNFEKIDKDLCKIGVFEGGEMVELQADCNICECETLCHTCTEEPDEEPDEERDVTPDEEPGNGS